MKTYFCHFSYFATGEGITFCLGMVLAENEDQAIEKFIVENMFSNLDHVALTDRIKEAVAYFASSVEVYDFHDETAHEAIKSIMKDFLSDRAIEHILVAADARALGKLVFHSHVNYS